MAAAYEADSSANRRGARVTLVSLNVTSGNDRARRAVHLPGVRVRLKAIPKSLRIVSRPESSCAKFSSRMTIRPFDPVSLATCLARTCLVRRDRYDTIFVDVSR